MNRSDSLVWSVLAALLLTGCSLPRFVRVGSKPPSPSPSPAGSPIAYGTPYDLPEAHEAPGVGAQTDSSRQSGNSVGTLILTLRDQNDANPSGIPLNMTGVIAGSYRSDNEGKFSFRASHPGKYTAQIPAGCHGPLIVEYGGGGAGYLVAGQTLRAELSVAWKHIVAPADAAFPSKGPTWPVGETIEITFDLYDRCRKERAENATFPTWSFRPSPNLEVVGKPSLQSDSRAQSRVSVRCKSTGEVSLVAFDTKNPPDEVDMVKAFLFEGNFSCGSG